MADEDGSGLGPADLPTAIALAIAWIVWATLGLVVWLMALAIVIPLAVVGAVLSSGEQDDVPGRMLEATTRFWPRAVPNQEHSHRLGARVVPGDAVVEPGTYSATG